MPPLTGLTGPDDAPLTSQLPRPDRPPGQKIPRFSEYLRMLGRGRKVNAFTIDSLRRAYMRKYNLKHFPPGGNPNRKPKPRKSNKPGAGSPPSSTSPSSKPPQTFDPKALPANAVLEDAIIDFDQQIANLPGRYNPARRALAANTAADLASAGLFNDVRVEEQDIGGNQAFRLHGQGRGRAFTNAIGQTNAAAAARGAFNSSFTRDRRAGVARQLEDSAAAAMRSFGGQQAAISQDQADALTSLMTGRLGARRDLADFQANTPVVTPPAPPPKPSPQQAGAGTQGPKQTISFAGGTQAGLQSRLDKRFGAGFYNVRSRGPKAGGFIAVRSK